MRSFLRDTSKDFACARAGCAPQDGESTLQRRSGRRTGDFICKVSGLGLRVHVVAAMLTETTAGREKRAPADRIRTVTSRDFQQLVLQGKGRSVVEFMSYGCVHCREMEPALQQVAKMVRTDEEIFRVNTAMEPELAESLRIVGTPTLVMFLDGREVGRDEGPPPTVSGVLAALTQAFE